MMRYIRRRLIAALPVLLGASILTFSILHLLPGDPVLIMLADSPGTPERIAELRSLLGFDDPIPIQYGRFLFNALHGDFGRSIRSNRPVLQEIWLQAPATIELAGAALGFSVVLGVTFGALAAYYENSWLDTLWTVVTLLGMSIPSFWLGMLLMYLFALHLGWLPATGQGGLERLVLPAMTLGAPGVAVIGLITRSSMREVLHEDYIVTARAKGLSNRVLVVRHALKNALIPVVTIIGLQFGTLLGGAVVVENVFARQGFGRVVVEAIMNRDYLVVQGAVLLASVTYVLINILVDISYAFLDPRIRYE